MFKGFTVKEHLQIVSIDSHKLRMIQLKNIFEYSSDFELGNRGNVRK